MAQIAFGKYTLLKRLARGGMAELFLARSSGLAGVERLAVIKVVAKRFAEDRSFVDMFQDEVRIAATLNHPHIGQVLDVGQVGSSFYLAMEHIHGHDLRAMVQRSLKDRGAALPPAFVVSVAVRICSALHCAHEARGLDGRPLGIVHRDVSPSNIMVTFDGVVKLVDFGIAKAANRMSLTQPGLIKGKVRYLSPEQVLGDEVDRRSDVFTLGTTIWESTVGRHLFDGDQDIQVYEAISKAWVRRPSALIPGYPAGLEQVLLCALARDPAQRFPNAQTMQRELERFAQKQGYSLSDIELSRHVRRLFGAEYEAWQQAEQRGESLLDFLCREGAAPPEDLGEAFGVTDGDPTVAQQPEAPPEATPGLQERRTVMFGEIVTPQVAGPAAAVVKPKASATGPITLGHAIREENEPRGVAEAQPERRRPPSSGLFRVGEGQAVKVTADGHADVIAVIGDVGSDPGADRRPTVMDPRVWTAAPPAGAAPVRLAQAESRHPSAEVPSAVEEQPEADAPPASQSDRSRTADWSHYRGDGTPAQRPGTHPYFQSAGATVAPADTSALSLPRSKTPFVVLGIVAVLVVAGAVAAYLGLRGQTSSRDQRGADAGRAVGGGGFAATRGEAVLRITTSPAGATVYRAADGVELGKTPLELVPGSVKGEKLELHLAGYEVTSLKLERSRHTYEVTLAPATSAADAGPPDAQAPAVETPRATESRRPAPVARPRPRRPRPKAAKTPRPKGRDDLLDPFD